MTQVSGNSNNRKPYVVHYNDLDGNPQTIRRVPPKQLHEMIVNDKVTITKQKSEVWDEGGDVKIIRITNRQPNTLQVENEEGKRTFLPYFDVNFKEREGEAVIFKDGKITKLALASKYLLWP